jgi:N-acetylglucosaminyldiphosphoundecaprenol N-acetyl-beta-D-mannosaminyltransferase
MQKTEKIKILKVKFDKVQLAEATEIALNLAKSKEKHFIATPNPEMLLEARKNPKFLEVLNSSSLNVPDGIGILWAAKYLEITKNNKSKTLKAIKWIFSLISVLLYPKYIKDILKERVSGIDLMEKICQKSTQENLKIFLLGAKEGVAEKTKEMLLKKYSDIQITGLYAGSPKEEEKIIIDKINRSEAQILFVAYGAPFQELWIARNLKKLHDIKLAMGVGGSFDFIAKIRKRAPEWMRKIGLEWIYRLLQQPSRLKRIYHAVIKFPIKIF